MLRLNLVSDLHGHLPAVSPCDLLIIAGDICPMGNARAQAKWLDVDFRAWLAQCAARSVVGIWGNHDFVGQKPTIIPRGLDWVLLQDSSVVIQGVKLWGSPWTLPYWNWAFMADEDKLDSFYATMPLDTDIAVVHGPPAGILDRTSQGTNAGSLALLDRLRVVRPALTVCGHIHEARGMSEQDFGLVANVSLCNRWNVPMFSPIDFEFTPA